MYGFRVPLLVVSAYTKYTGTCTSGQPCVGYISGTPAQGGEVTPYIHDFGSILNFTEYTFGLTQGGIYSNYPYADFYAPDSPSGGSSGCGYPLKDFFNFAQAPRTFAPISGAKYLTSCFFPNPSSCFGTNYPADPDDDEIDQ